jgi:hypothetical protein
MGRGASGAMTFARELIAPAAICAATFAVALAMTIAAGLTGTEILFAYFDIAGFTTLLAFLIWCLLPFCRPPEFRNRGPISAGAALLKRRGMLLFLPLFLFPIFMTGFTLSKSAFPAFLGFQWDGFWTAADAWLFGGQDPWRLTHAWFGLNVTLFLGQCYTFIWGLIIALVPPFLLFARSPDLGVRFYTAQMWMWFLGGVVGATLFSSAGPIFADLVDPALAERFAPLKTSLAALLPEGHALLRSQEYLRNHYGLGEAIKGAGISAMPSMHLGVCAMFVIVARGTIWLIPATIFWLLIWVGSVHFGYHYALDGIVGALSAWLGWVLAAPRRPVAVKTEAEELAIA